MNVWGRSRDLGKQEKAIRVLQERSSCTRKRSQLGNRAPTPQTLLSSATPQGYNMQTSAQPLPLEYCGSQNNFLELPSMKTGSPAPCVPRNAQQADQAKSLQANVAGMMVTYCGAPLMSQDRCRACYTHLSLNQSHSLLCISFHRA